MTENFNLNEKINFVYNKYYDGKKKGNSDPLALSEFKSLNLDKTLINHDNPQLENIMKQISSSKLKTLGNDSDCITFKRYSDNLPVNIHLYNDSTALDLENDLKFSKFLSPLVGNDRSKTRHILLPIYGLNLNKKQINQLVKQNKEIDNYIKNNSSFKLGAYESVGFNSSNMNHSKVYPVMIKENFFKSNSLKDYIKINTGADSSKINQLNKKLFFQVVHTLALIEDNYPEFRHNDLSLDNIMVYKKSMNKQKYNSIDNINSKNESFQITENNFDIKIGNFGKSKLLKKPSYKFYDLNNFIDDYLIFTDKEEIKIDKDTKVFISNIKSKISESKKSNRELKYSKLLKDSYFKNFLLKDKATVSAKGGGVNEHIKFKSDNYKNYLGDQNIEQAGGYDRSQVPFKREKNTPFISNDEKNTISRRIADNPPPKEPPVLAEQKIYDLDKPKSQVVLPQVYPPMHVPVSNPYYPDPSFQYANGFKPNQIPVQKYYNITMSNPVGNHSTINRIYEDMLPVDPKPFTLTTIYERKQLTTFFRNMILEYGDGEEINISPTDKKSFLSYIRLLEINPYTEKKNPYYGLPKGFLIYNAAYPIKYEQEKNHLAIVKNPIGLNIRLYELSLGAFRCFKINNNIDADDFDVWRDIKYYEYIREEIIKKKISPNFTSLYLYSVDTVSRIDYKQINLLKYKSYPKGDLEKEENNIDKINNVHDLIVSTFYPTKGYADSFVDAKKFKEYQKKKVDLNESKSNSLVALTEAPNNNLIKWASPLYQSFGSIQQQVETGYHSPLVWKSILFQMVYACAVLQETNIYFQNFSIDGNFYIKDLSSDPGKRNHWIYKVGNNDFYVPNFGYLLMVDSDFADIYGQETSQSIFESQHSSEMNSSRIFKINGSNLYSKNSKMGIDYSKEALKAFKNVINPDAFNHELRKRKGQSPDSSIISILRNMYEDNDESIRNYLLKYFSDFMNNRVGTLLTREEKDNLPTFPDTSYSEGELVAYQERFGDYKWAIFIEDVPGILNKKRIKLDYKSNPVEVYPNSLWKYPSNEPIKQITKDGILLDPEFILETYTLDNIIQ